VAKGTPADVFKMLYKKYTVKLVTFEAEQVEPYGKKRDEQIQRISNDAGVKTKIFNTHTLFDQEFLLKRNGNQVPSTY